MTVRKRATGAHRVVKKTALAPVDLTGQVALVTGGGRGLGRDLCLALGKAGASVAVVARSSEQIASAVAEIRDAGGRAAAFAIDVTNDGAVEKMARRVEAELGPVDLLVNNAATGPPFGPIHEIDAEEWWRCIEVNLRGPLLCARAVLPSMISRGKGRIVNVASGAGATSIPHLSAYAVSKTALIRMTEILADEVRSRGLGVFAITPGPMKTAMSEEALRHPEARTLIPDLVRFFEQERDYSTRGAVDLIVFLAAGKADRLSGRLIQVEGDVQAMVRNAKEIVQGDLHVLRLRTSS